MRNIWLFIDGINRRKKIRLQLSSRYWFYKHLENNQCYKIVIQCRLNKYGKWRKIFCVYAIAWWRMNVYILLNSLFGLTMEDKWFRKRYSKIEKLINKNKNKRNNEAKWLSLLWVSDGFFGDWCATQPISQRSTKLGSNG